MPRFTPRQRKHKARAREQDARPAATATETNQAIVVPLSKSEREEKKQGLREELRAQQPKISSKKQKRLDKYIENKLRKDETLDLVRKLEKEKEKYDAIVPPQSAEGIKHAGHAASLGKRKFDDYRSGTIASQASRAPDNRFDGETDSSDLDSDDSFDPGDAEAVAVDLSQKPQDSTKSTHPPAAVQGSGLAQPLALDENGLPVVPSRQRKKRKAKNDEPPDELPWEGFDTESSDPEPPESDRSSSTPTNDESSHEDSDADSGGLDSADSEADQDGSGSPPSDTSSTSSNPGRDKLRPRRSAFKAWATQQLNRSIGHVPSYNDGDGVLAQAPAPTSTRLLLGPVPLTEPGPTDNGATAHEGRPNRTAYAVHVDRPKDIEESRAALPILQREQEIMEAIHNHPVVVIKGDTGSGKTTQVPQFLFEAGYGARDGPTPGMIGITQPRRVATVSTAKRVQTELGPHGDKVAYQIRFDSTLSAKTAVKFMTDGILLRELSQDLLLRKYSAIIIDEAHERSVNTDILIGMLSKIVPARAQKSAVNTHPTPLKLIIMSATLNIAHFLNDRLFPAAAKPPVVEAEGRQHRVTTHFALKSRADYVDEVVEKVRRAHRKLPRGGILVFLTGQNEIRQTQRRLAELLNPHDRRPTSTGNARVQLAASEAPLEAEDVDVGNFQQVDGHDDFDLEILTASDEEAEDKDFEISDDEQENQNDAEQTLTHATSGTTSSKDPYHSAHILPLYSQLPTSEQLKVFDPPPAGARLVILATNVAETSLTIPGVRFVIDAGRSKERRYNLDSGVQSFEIDYISKASAQQRAGRAGRTGPGHCWRLYTSAVYERFFPDHADPEILRAPAESVVLQLKAFSYPRPVADFPFPTLPVAATLRKAEELLQYLGALTTDGRITDLGRQLSVYPLSPRLAKIMAAGAQDPGLVGHVLTLVAALAIPEIFVTEAQLDLTGVHRPDADVYTREAQQDDDARDRLRQAYGRARATLSNADKTSDAMKRLTAVAMYLEAPNKTEWCHTFFLRPKAMSEIGQLRGQLDAIFRANHRSIDLPEAVPSATNKLPASRIRQLNMHAASGYVDQVAVRYDRAPVPPEVAVKPRRVIDVPYLPLIPIHDGPAAAITDKAIYVHPSSVLARLTVKELPEYIVYSQLQRSQGPMVGAATVAADQGGPKTRMFPLTGLDGAQLAHLARETALMVYGKPVPKTEVKDLPGLPRRRECWVTSEVKGNRVGALGWPLPPVKVRQVLDSQTKTGWRVETVLS